MILEGLVTTTDADGATAPGPDGAARVEADFAVHCFGRFRPPTPTATCERTARASCT